MRLQEIKSLRALYGEMYSWKEQCEALVNRMQRMGLGKSYLLVADVLNDYVVPDIITHGKSYLFSAAVCWPNFSLRVPSSLVWEASSQGFRKQFCKKRKQFFLVLVRFFSDSFGCSRELWSFYLIDLISHDRKQGKTTIFDGIPSQDCKGFSDVRTCNNTRKQLKNYALAQTGGKHGKNVFPPSQIMQPRFCSNNPHQCFGNL